MLASSSFGFFLLTRTKQGSGTKETLQAEVNFKNCVTFPGERGEGHADTFTEHDPAGHQEHA